MYTLFPDRFTPQDNAERPAEELMRVEEGADRSVSRRARRGASGASSLAAIGDAPRARRDAHQASVAEYSS
jgi:hypothetical protein